MPWLLGAPAPWPPLAAGHHALRSWVRAFAAGGRADAHVRRRPAEARMLCGDGEVCEELVIYIGGGIAGVTETVQRRLFRERFTRKAKSPQSTPQSCTHPPPRGPARREGAFIARGLSCARAPDTVHNRFIRRAPFVDLFHFYGTKAQFIPACFLSSHRALALLSCRSDQSAATRLYIRMMPRSAGLSSAPAQPYQVGLLMRWRSSNGGRIGSTSSRGHQCTSAEPLRLMTRRSCGSLMRRLRQWSEASRSLGSSALWCGIWVCQPT